MLSAKAIPESAAMTQIELANWLAVYAATGICCAFAMIMSVSTVGYELYRERTWRTVTDLASAAQIVPKIWWRWQKRYLFSTPVTLAIVGAFALTLDWTH